MEKQENTENDYAAFNERMGLSGSESTHDLKEIAGKAALFSAGSNSDVKPRMIPVGSIKNFAELNGGKNFSGQEAENVAYFAAPEDFTIDSEITVDVTEAPVVWNYNTITFQPGGSINVIGNNADASSSFTINCVSMFKQ